MVVKHLGHEVELALDIRTAGATEPGYPVDCDMCQTQMIVASVGPVPVVCQSCWDILIGKEFAAANGFDLGI